MNMEVPTSHIHAFIFRYLEVKMLETVFFGGGGVNIVFPRGCTNYISNSSSQGPFSTNLQLLFPVPLMV